MKEIACKLRNLYHRVSQFFYYGKIGYSLNDWDSQGVYTLTNAHLKRVNKFMKSDQTHLMWNDDENTKLMRRLREMSELSERMESRDIGSGYYLTKFQDTYPDFEPIPLRGNDEKYSKDFIRAIELDSKILKQERKRYFHLFEKYLDHWWD